MFYEIPLSLAEEINELESFVEKYRRGELDSASLKVRRVPFGCYEQRRNGSFMLRIRATGGAITPLQLGKIASLSSQYGADAVHITTRQEFQIHDVGLEHVVPILRELLSVGLSTRGGGGNTVRNIMISPDAGLSEVEAFDPSPYVFALTTKLIAEPDSWSLPRKLKIAFSNSAADSSFAQFNDVGFIASARDGEEGFKVYVAGGMGRKPTVGHLLHEFIRVDAIYAVVTAVKRVFDQYGNRRNRNAARLRFLWDQLGEQRFLELYRKEFDAVVKLPTSLLDPLLLPKLRNASSPESQDDDSPSYRIWKKRYCREQREKGLYSILVPVTLGNIKNSNLLALATFLEEIGRDTVRATLGQNLLLRNVPGALLRSAHGIAQRISDLSDRPALLSNAIACTGANTCRLGICLPKGALSAIEQRLSTSGLDLDQIADFRLNLSGCPNTCGQHMIADLGFFGQARRKGDRVYPAYGVVAGSVHADGKARLAQPIDQINARDLPHFVAEVLEHWIEAKSHFASFADYVDAEGATEMHAVCDRYRDVPDFGDDESYYFDWGRKEVFSLGSRRPGECSADLFDLINVDSKMIEEQRNRLEQELTRVDRADALYRIVLSAARMLLVTRGVEASADSTVFTSFVEHFLDAGLVEPSHQEVVDLAMSQNPAALLGHESAVYALGEEVQQLYATVGNSLRISDKVAELAPAI